MSPLAAKATGDMLDPRVVYFALVGSLGVVVHLIVLWTALTAGLSFFTAQIIATLVAMTGNFLLNNEITYRDHRLKGAAAVKGLIERTRIEASEALTALWPGSSGGGVQVRLGNGAVLEKMYRYPPGHPQNPLSDAAIERRLFELSHDVLPRVAAQAVIDAVWRLEADEDLARLASALAVDA